MSDRREPPRPSSFFSELRRRGSSNNKALEIYNGTGAAVDLAANAYNVQMFFNGERRAGLTINLTGTRRRRRRVRPRPVARANATILAQADQTNGAGWFNGDDAVVLRKGTAVVDAIGQAGFDPGTEWGTGLVSTADNTLRRRSATSSSATRTRPTRSTRRSNGTDSPQDTFDGLRRVSPVTSATPPRPCPSTHPGEPARRRRARREPVGHLQRSRSTCPRRRSRSRARRSGAHTVVVGGGPDHLHAWTRRSTSPPTSSAASSSSPRRCPTRTPTIRRTSCSAARASASRTGAPSDPCADPFTPIPEIQGSGPAAADHRDRHDRGRGRRRLRRPDERGPPGLLPPGRDRRRGRRARRTASSSTRATRPSCRLATWSG